VHNLTQDARHWLQADDLRTEIARIHHRIVCIHPFPNVNGRHGRLWCDLIAQAVEERVPTWAVPASDYLSALRHADRTEELRQLVDVMWASLHRDDV
jgi:fido (protein-threonine AMPylation protein)